MHIILAFLFWWNLLSPALPPALVSKSLFCSHLPWLPPISTPIEMLTIQSITFNVSIALIFTLWLKYETVTDTKATKCSMHYSANWNRWQGTWILTYTIPSPCIQNNNCKIHYSGNCSGDKVFTIPTLIQRIWPLTFSIPNTGSECTKCRIYYAWQSYKS